MQFAIRLFRFEHQEQTKGLNTFRIFGGYSFIVPKFAMTVGFITQVDHKSRFDTANENNQAKQAMSSEQERSDCSQRSTTSGFESSRFAPVLNW